MDESPHESDPEVAPDIGDEFRDEIGDETWAHNRWPVVGLYTGGGIGLLLGVVFFVGWLLTIVFMIGLAVAGCVVGFVAAKLVYHRPRRATEPRDRPG